MYYRQDEINSLLNQTSPEQREDELHDGIADLAPRIAAKRNEYRHFGPYWWWVKPHLRQSPGARRSWLRGGYSDRGFVDSIGDGVGVDPTLAWIGLHYYRTEIVDDTPAGFHIVETSPRNVIAYTVYDADASEQLDLFPGSDKGDAIVTEFLADPARYTGGTWLMRAEEYIVAGHPFSGAAALRRAITRTVVDSDRLRAWILLGQLFQEVGHVRKALFCYQNAFEREREAWIQGLMGDAWLQAEEPHEAVQCFHAALTAMPGNPEYVSGLDRARRATAEHDRVAAGYELYAERLAR